MLTKITVGSLETNCYVLSDDETSDAVIIDPGADGDMIIEHIKQLGLKPGLILNTHGHFDHIGANAAVKDEFDIDLMIHGNDVMLLSEAKSHAAGFGFPGTPSPGPNHTFKDGETITLGSMKLTVVHTPGHTPGCVCFYKEDEALLVTGDTLFAGSVGRTDLPGGSFPTLIDSLRTKIMPFDDNVRVLPGHGPGSTIGHEKRTNPYLVELREEG